MATGTEQGIGSTQQQPGSAYAGQEQLPKDAHRNLTDKIIGAAISVSNELGIGFLEQVYERALEIELEELGLDVSRQQAIPVSYKGKHIGLYYADLLVEDSVVIELKAIDSIARAHEAQLLNYLRATGTRVGLILNFGTPRLGIRRLVF